MACVVVLGCAGAPAASYGTERCGDVEGAWSAPVDGLRGRLVTSGSRADHTALRVDVELENVGDAPLAIHWDGRPSLGFVTFALADRSGADVPDPPWRLGGNEPGGSMAEVIGAHATVRHTIPNVFDRFDGGRIVRIGAFWGMPMPEDGALLRGTVAGREGAPDDLGVVPGDEVLVRGEPIAAGLRTWRGPLELPPVCLD